MIVSVLANGCFDLLHAGHVEHLREARAMGHWLVVALTVDEAVGKGPGRPVQTWEDRAAVLGALRFVDQVVPSTDAPSAIRRYRPRIFVKGADYAERVPEADRAACVEVGAEFRFTRAAKRSTTEILRRLALAADALRREGV